MEVFVFVEGQTEEMFVKRLLGPHLAKRSVLLTPLRPGKPNKWGHRGYGVPPYKLLRPDIVHQLSSDPSGASRLTTMLDLYALPDDYPGFQEAVARGCPLAKVRLLEKAMADDIGDPRFIPHLQLHEFEALLLADPMKIAAVLPECHCGVQALADEVRDYATAEDVDEGEDTHPSARISRATTGFRYDKPLHGLSIAEEVGLPVMRKRCPHFAEWLAALEVLAE